MKWRMTIGIIILFLSNPWAGCTQTPEEIGALQGIMAHPHPEKPYKALTRNNENGIKVLFSGLFLVYKEFVSSQDGQSCSFTPSCSEYALQSIRKKGIFLGLMNAFDRLSRCNGLSPEHYDRDPKTQLLVDPL